MRKYLSLAVAVVAVAFAGTAVAGDFELSGHVNAGVSYQHFGSNAASVVAGQTGLANPGANTAQGSAGDLTASAAGAAGAAGAVVAPTVRQDSFLIFADDAELDATAEYGENIRARVDLGFGRLASGSSGAGGVNLEQAYATINIPVGNGIEFLVGRFDAPIGFESVERGENTLFSHSTLFRNLRPTSYTGLKFYYPFSDLIDLHVYAVNNLRDSIALVGANTDPLLPSGGFRLGFGWGDEGQKSTFGLSAAGGLEAPDASKLGGDLSWLVDADWNVWIGEYFAIGGEGIYRMDNGATGAAKARYFGGQLNLHYVFNDVWDGTLRYVYAADKGAVNTADTLTGGAANISLLNAAAGAAKTQVHEITLGGQYHITDNAKLQLEGRYDMVKVTGASAGNVYGGLVNFAYNF